MPFFNFQFSIFNSDEALLVGIASVLGAIVGSFLNVVIHRYPLGQSIVFPPSHCPSCEKAIRWFDNVPVLSYLLLGGRCRSCRKPIDSRYPLIELANALFYGAIAAHTGASLLFVPLAAVVSMTIVLIYIDLDIQILPDVIDLPGIAIGMMLGFAGAGRRLPELTLTTDWVDSLIGAVAAGGILWSVAIAYQLIRKVEGMGLGDVKMLAMIGAVVGWRAVLPILFLASFFGAALGLGLAARRSEGLQLPIPFGVFLGLATLAFIFFGTTLSEWYRSVLPG